jgi:hypothetical protein
MNAATDTLHVFERAGLGKAPFRCVGVEVRRGPMPLLDAQGRETGGFVGSPGQPLGVCDYCGTCIAECFLIRAADDKLFIVGCDCVRKTGDAGLRKVVDQKVREMRKAAEEARINRATERVRGDQDLRTLLGSLPSPNARRAEQRGDSALVWAEWMLRHAGHSGCLKVARFVDKAEHKAKAGRP